MEDYIGDAADILVCLRCGEWKSVEIAYWVRPSTGLLVEPFFDTNEVPDNLTGQWCPGCGVGGENAELAIVSEIMEGFNVLATLSAGAGNLLSDCETCGLRPGVREAYRGLWVCEECAPDCGPDCPGWAVFNVGDYWTAIGDLEKCDNCDLFLDDFEAMKAADDVLPPERRFSESEGRIYVHCLHPEHNKTQLPAFQGYDPNCPNCVDIERGIYS